MPPSFRPRRPFSFQPFMPVTYSRPSAGLTADRMIPVSKSWGKVTTDPLGHRAGVAGAVHLLGEHGVQPALAEAGVQQAAGQRAEPVVGDDDLPAGELSSSCGIQTIGGSKPSGRDDALAVELPAVRGPPVAAFVCT